MNYSWPELKSPKISVVVCNYNYEKFICSAISSISTQTLKAFEIILVDDGSTDSSVELVRQTFPDIKIITKKNEGQISAYNRGFVEVSGDVVIFLDSDDELLPNALNDISVRFSENVVKVHGKMTVIDSEGVRFNTVLPNHISDGDCGFSLLNDGVLYKSPPASANAYRVSALNILFPLPQTPDEKHGADYYCIYGISLLGLIEKTDDPIIRYRIHQSANNAVNSLGFGNAVKLQNRAAVMQKRWNILGEWLKARLDSNLQLKSQYIDFTQQKLFYATDILSANNLCGRSKALRSHYPTIFRAINLRNDLNILKKAVLYVWVITLLVLPSKYSFNIAKMVCNPIR